MCDWGGGPNEMANYLPIPADEPEGTYPPVLMSWTLFHDWLTEHPDATAEFPEPQEWSGLVYTPTVRYGARLRRQRDPDGFMCSDTLQATADLAAARSAIRELTDQANAAAAARDALPTFDECRPYMRHHANCRFALTITGIEAENQPCDCGFDAILRQPLQLRDLSPKP